MSDEGGCRSHGDVQHPQPFARYFMPVCVTVIDMWSVGDGHLSAGDPMGAVRIDFQHDASDTSGSSAPRVPLSR